MERQRLDEYPGEGDWDWEPMGTGSGVVGGGELEAIVGERDGLDECLEKGGNGTGMRSLRAGD